MRILLMVHPDFLALPSSGDRARVWIERYESALKKRGYEAVRFEPRRHKLKDFDVVHFFSCKEGETWKAIRDGGTLVVVTPALFGALCPRGDSLREKFGMNAFKIGLALWQRKWPPVTRTSFMNSANGYFAPKEWSGFIEKEWRIPSERITDLPSDPELAAALFEKCFLI